MLYDKRFFFVLAAVTVIFGVLRFTIPAPGLRPDDIFKDLAHLFVGFLFGVGTRSSKAFRLALGLTAVEILAFGLGMAHGADPWKITQTSQGFNWTITNEGRAAPCGIDGCPCGCRAGAPCVCKGIHWEAVTYGDALAKGKPLLIYFSTDPCPPCEKMRNEIFTQRSVIEASREFTCIKADVGLTKLFGVTRFPTLVIVRNGKQFHSVGCIPAERIVQFLQTHEITQVMVADPSCCTGPG